MLAGPRPGLRWRAITFTQRREDADHGREGAAGEVGHLHAERERRSVDLARDAQRAGASEVADVVPGLLGARAGLAVSGDRAQDGGWIRGVDRLPAGAEAIEDARPEALDHHVRLRGEREEAGDALGRAKIDGDRSLAVVERDERHALRVVDGGALVGRHGEWRHHARHVASGHLGMVDADDVRAEIGQQTGAGRAGEEPGGVEDAEPWSGGSAVMPGSIARIGLQTE